MVKLNKWSLKR